MYISKDAKHPMEASLPKGLNPMEASLPWFIYFKIYPKK